MKEAYKEAGDIVIRAVQFVISLLMILFLVRILPEKEHILSRFGKRTFLVYMLNFYFVEILFRVLPEGVGVGWNAVICLLYSFGSICIMNSQVSRTVFDKIIRLTEKIMFRY